MNSSGLYFSTGSALWPFRFTIDVSALGSAHCFVNVSSSAICSRLSDAGPLDEQAEIENGSGRYWKSRNTSPFETRTPHMQQVMMVSVITIWLLECDPFQERVTFQRTR